MSLIELTNLSCIGNRGADLALAGGAILGVVGDSGRGSPIAAAWLSAVDTSIQARRWAYREQGRSQD